MSYLKVCALQGKTIRKLYTWPVFIAFGILVTSCSILTNEDGKNFSYSNIWGVVGRPIDTVSASWNQDPNPEATYTVEPALPAGILIDKNSGTISGIPSSTLTTTSYTITANLGDGVQKQTSLTIAINDISFNYPEITGLVGEAILTVTPYWPKYGPANETYELSPSLPEGLNFNKVTGEISGTPTTHTSSTTTYTVTATLAGGITREADLDITIEQVGFSYSGDFVGISGESYLNATVVWNSHPSSTII